MRCTLAFALVALVTLVAPGCRGTKQAGAESPVYTPAVANSVRNLAPTCEVVKNPNVDDVVEIRDCRGPHGSVTIALAADDRVRRVDVKLRPMTTAEAKTQLTDGIGPLAGKALTDKLTTLLGRLTTGQRDSAEVGNARLEIVAGGTNTLMPEYVVNLSW